MKKKTGWGLLLAILFLNSGSLGYAATEKSSENGISEYGPILAYQQVEAESCETNGKIIADERAYFTPGSEASGKSYVRLDQAGQTLSFKTEVDSDSLIIRGSVPDSSTGGGEEHPLILKIGENTQTIQLSSKLSWVYGDFPWTNDPADGRPHNYFDDHILTFSEIIPAGTEITLEVPAVKDTAAFYLIDLLDTELQPAIVPQPEDSLSITDFGAVANDGKDDSVALNEAIAEAATSQQTVYLPAGTYEIYNPALVKGILLTKDNLEIAGAGMWHTRLETKTAGFYIRGENITVRDLALFGQTDVRRDNEPPGIAVESDTGQSRNISLENLWIEHTKVGVWANRIDHLKLTNSRVRNVMADGINLCRGTSNSEVSYSDFRNTGDDGIAMWSSSLVDQNNKIFHNTVRYPWLANNIAIYGGEDHEVYGNDLRDTVGMGGGINISTRFKPQPFAGSHQIYENQLLRCGSLENDTKAEYGAIWVNTEPGFDNAAQIQIKNNKILDSPYQGIYLFNSGKLTNMTFSGNQIKGGTTYGIEVDPSAQGKVTLTNNEIQEFSEGKFKNESQLILTEVSATKTKGKNSSSKITGIVLGIGAVGLLIAGGLWIWYRKSRHRK